MAERQLQFKKTSSNIQSAFWDDETLDLRVVFKSGHSGVHPGTSQDEALAWERADSPGSHYDTYFKKAGKAYNKIG
jgi:hypothetical protein